MSKIFQNRTATVASPGNTICVLGNGGTSLVEKVRIGEKLFAQKRLHPSLEDLNNPKKLESLKQRFSREIDLIRSLRHPNIPEIDAAYDYQFSDECISLPAYRMTLAKMSLGELQSKSRRTQTSLSEMLGFFWQVSYTLAFVHARGIIHRDLKPDNFLITEDNTILLTDFGLSKNTDSEDSPLTKFGSIAGTPGFQAPEQAVSLESTTKRSDVYSFGASLVFLLCGTCPDPYDSDSCSNLLKSSLDTDTGLIEFLSTCTALRPEDRFADGSELAAEFYRIIENLVIEGMSESLPVPPSYFEAVLQMAELGTKSFISLMPLSYEVSPKMGVSTFASILSTKIIKQAYNKDLDSLIRLLRSFDTSEYSRSQAWSDVETGGKLYRTVSKNLARTPKHLDTYPRIRDAQKQLASSLLERSVALNRYEGGREFLRFFEEPNSIELSILEEVLRENPEGESFLKEDVDYRWLKLSTEAESLLGN